MEVTRYVDTENCHVQYCNVLSMLFQMLDYTFSQQKKLKFQAIGNISYSNKLHETLQIAQVER